MRNAWTHKIQWSGPTVHSSTVLLVLGKNMADVMESHEQNSEESQYFETRYVACPEPEETQIVEEAGVRFLCFFFISSSD